jgi:predicted PurR-regulated permease PerM
MEHRDSQRWFLLAVVLAVGGLLYVLSPILTPFVASAFLAYLGDPLVDRLETLGLKRALAVTLVFLLILLSLLGLGLVLVPLLEDQISTLFAKMPGYIEWVRGSLVPWVQGKLGVESELQLVARLQGMLAEHWDEAGGIASGILASVSRSGLALMGWLANLVLIPVLTFYLLRDWDDIIAGIHALLPRNIEPVVSGLTRESDEMLGAFLRGQLTVMAALAVMYSAGLAFVGLDLALLIGMFAGLVSFVPYLGLILGILISAVAAVLQFQGWEQLPWVALVFVLAQMVEGYLLTPKLVGGRIGLHPVAVIFAIMVGGQLYGFLGVLLALPVAAVVMVIIRHGVTSYRASSWYTGVRAPAPGTPGEDGPF